MPELPEVETMRRGIAPILGLRIDAVAFPRGRCRPISVQPSTAAYPYYAALPAGALSTEAKAALQAKFSGVAEAYTGAQWARAFGSRGLAAKDFGH